MIHSVSSVSTNCFVQPNEWFDQAKESLAGKIETVRDRICTAYEKMPAGMIGEEEEEEGVEGDIEQAKPVSDKKNTRAPFGKREWTWLVGGTALIMGLSVMLRDQRLVGAAMVGAWIDFIRVAYRNLPAEGWEKVAFRVMAVFALCEAFIAYQLTPANSVWNAVPWMAFALSIFVKCELNRMEPEKKLSEKFQIGEEGAKWIANGVQCGLATLLTAPALPALIQAPAAIMAKSKMRTVANMAIQKILTIKDSATRKTALFATYILLPVIAVASLMALRNRLVTSMPGIISVAFINTAAIDTAVRLFKSFLWNLSPLPAESDALEKKQEEAWKTAVVNFLGKATRGLAFLGMAFAITYPMQKLLANPNMPFGLVATLAQECNILFKPLLRDFVGIETGLFLNLFAISALSFGTKGYGLLTALLVDNSLYGMKRNVRPPKLKMPKEKPAAKAVDKAAKKAAKKALKGKK